MYCKYVFNFQDMREWSYNGKGRLGNMGRAMDNTIREVQQKNWKQPRRVTSMPSNLDGTNLYANEEQKCGRCGEYVAKIVHLKTKRKRYKEKKSTLKQEIEKLKSQLNGRRETNLWCQHVVSYVLP